MKPAELNNVAFIKLIKKLYQHFNSEANLNMGRFMLNKRHRKPEEITDYIAELCRLSYTL